MVGCNLSEIALAGSDFQHLFFQVALKSTQKMFTWIRVVRIITLFVWYSFDGAIFIASWHHLRVHTKCSAEHGSKGGSNTYNTEIVDDPSIMYIHFVNISFDPLFRRVINLVEAWEFPVSVSNNTCVFSQWISTRKIYWSLLFSLVGVLSTLPRTSDLLIWLKWYHFQQYLYVAVPLDSEHRLVPVQLKHVFF